MVGYWYEQLTGDSNNPAVLGDFKGRTAAQEDHDDHSRYTDDDAQHGEEGAQNVAPNLAQGD